MTDVKFDPILRPFESVHSELGTQQQFRYREIFIIGNTQHEKRAVAEKQEYAPGRSRRAVSGIHWYGSAQIAAP